MIRRRSKKQEHFREEALLGGVGLLRLEVRDLKLI